ncbi:unnamed protein product, partial [Polarella glacialis]
VNQTRAFQRIKPRVGLAQPHEEDRRSGLKFFIYALHGKFHRRIVEGLSSLVDPSHCPPLDWPCTMDTPPSWRTYTGHSSATFWQYLAEVVILQKLVGLGALLTSPFEADILVVPAFLSAGSFVVGDHTGRAAYWYSREKKPDAFTFQDLLLQLPYYNHPDVRGKHLFLRTSDCDSSQWLGHVKLEGVPCDWMTQDSVCLSLGAAADTGPEHVGHVVVPPFIVEEEFQPSFWSGESQAQNRSLLLFLQCSAGINPARLKLVESLRPYAQRDPSVMLVTMGEHLRIPVLSQRETAKHMRDATFCPIPPGDLPYTTRYFMAIFSGCIPVVVLYRGGSWWR